MPTYEENRAILLRIQAQGCGCMGPQSCPHGGACKCRCAECEDAQIRRGFTPGMIAMLEEVEAENAQT